MTACSSNGDEGDANQDLTRDAATVAADSVTVEESEADVHGSSDQNSMVLPIETYMFDVDAGLSLTKAHGRLVEECMDEQGFEWTAGQGSGAAPYRSVADRRYGLVNDSETATKYGYHVTYPQPSGDPAASSETPSDEVLEALAGAEGPSMERGGCLGEADRQLGKDLDLAEVQGTPELAQDVNFGSYSRSLQNEQVIKAFREWSECMGERGYDLSTPRDAPNEYLPAGFDVSDGRPPSEAEVEMALWDVQCQERSGSTETWFEVESEIQREMIEEKAEAFEQLAAENEELLRRAAEVLKSAGE